MEQYGTENWLTISSETKFEPCTTDHDFWIKDAKDHYDYIAVIVDDSPDSQQRWNENHQSHERKIWILIQRS